MDAREVEEYVKRVNEQRRSAAEETRRRGRVRYVLIDGALQLGGLLAILASLVAIGLTGPNVNPPLIGMDVPRVVRWMIFLSPFAATVGVLARLWMWHLFRKRWWNAENGN